MSPTQRPVSEMNYSTRECTYIDGDFDAEIGIQDVLTSVFIPFLRLKMPYMV